MWNARTLSEECLKTGALKAVDTVGNYSKEFLAKNLTWY